MVALAPFLLWRFWRQKNKAWFFLLSLFLLFWLAIFLILPVAKPLYLKISLLQKFQFAWRFLSLAVLIPPIFAGALIGFLPKKFKLPIVCFLLLAVFLLNKNYWQPKDFLLKEESFYQEPYPGTTDTGESAPRWSIRFMEDYPEAPLAVIDGQAEFQVGERTTNQHFYQVKAAVPTRLVENTLYFPGWQVLVDGQSVLVEFQDPAHRGLMTFFVEPGEHELKIIFKETRLRLFANYLSLAGFLSLLALGLVEKRTLPLIKKRFLGLVRKRK